MGEEGFGRVWEGLGLGGELWMRSLTPWLWMEALTLDWVVEADHRCQLLASLGRVESLGGDRGGFEWRRNVPNHDS